MKKTFLFFMILLLSNVTDAQQKRFSIGIRSNVGLHGSPPFSWRNKKEALSRVDLGFLRPKINFSSAVLLKYSLNKSQKINWNLTLEAGYDFSALRKEWHFRSGYDNEFIQYLRESRIIHELRSHQFIIPIKINVEVFRKIILSVGVVRTNILSASIDRTKKSSVDLISGLWMDEKVTWKADKEGRGIAAYNTPFLTKKWGLEGTIGFGYYISDHIIVGGDLNAILSRGAIRVYANSDNPSDFFYASDKATVKLIFML